MIKKKLKNLRNTLSQIPNGKTSFSVEKLGYKFSNQGDTLTESTIIIILRLKKGTNVPWKNVLWKNVPWKNVPWTNSPGTNVP